MSVYLDNAATTAIAPEVVEVMVPLLKHQFGNPSSTHAFGREVKSVIELARKQIAQLLGATPGEIIFTSGGTEADNMALSCAIADLGVKRIITSPIEHHAVLHTAEHLCKQGDIKLEHLRLEEFGHLDLNHLETLLSSDQTPTLVSVMHANNEIGNLIDLKVVGELCHKYGALFHSDTVQTMGHFAFNFAELPVDFATGAAHKFHGPKGVGFLFVNKKLKLNPMIHGGAQERNKRGGTENVYGIAGMAKALEISLSHVEEHKAYIQDLKEYMMSELAYRVGDVMFNGDAMGFSNYTVLNVSLPPSKRASMFLFSMDMKGVAISGGSACSSGSQVGSHVLAALGVDKNRPTARFSFSRYNTKEDINFCVNRIIEFYEEEKALAI